MAQIYTFESGGICMASATKVNLLRNEFLVAKINCMFQVAGVKNW